MCPRRGAVLLETSETHLHHHNLARREGRRLFPGRTEISSATLPAISDRAAPHRVARARTLGACEFSTIPAAFAAAHDGLAMELKTDLPESGSARLLRSMGKRTGGSETDKSEFPDSIGDIRPVPCSQATMVECATSNALGATDRIDRGTSTSPALS